MIKVTVQATANRQRGRTPMGYKYDKRTFETQDRTGLFDVLAALERDLSEWNVDANYVITVAPMSTYKVTQQVEAFDGADAEERVRNGEGAICSTQ